MPLFKSSSKKAMGKNIKAEMDAGKPQKQAIAIAYSVKRQAAKKKKMAFGGKAEDDMNPHVSTHEGRDDEMGHPMSKYMGDKWAEGGKLTVEDRKHIKAKNFAGPDRSYPIEDASHARNALARVSQFGSPEEKAEVRRKVYAKYPHMGEDEKEKMAFGGKAEYDGNEHLNPYEGRNDELAEPVDEYMANQWSKGSAPKRKPDDERLPMAEYMDDQFAEGGSIVDRIMQKRMRGQDYSEEMLHQKEQPDVYSKEGKINYADGGEVEGSDHDSENPADMWEEDEIAGLKENYSDSGSHLQPLESNEHGHVLHDEDSFDMVDQIRKKLKSRK